MNRVIVAHQRKLNRLLQAGLLLPAVAFSHLLYAESGAVIDQERGSTNMSSITQIDAPNAYGDILQNGDTNVATILQVGPVDEYLHASITQYGSSHQANLEQTDVDVNATADVVQGGGNNVAEGRQSDARRVSLSIEQSGENNYGYIDQRNNTTADITQVGEGHFAQIEQLSFGLFQYSASVYQGGNFNHITVLQEGEAQGDVTTHQIGNNNSMAVYQSSEGVPTGVFATLTTGGDNNNVTLDQDGFQNRFMLDQFGDGNVVDAYQSGEAVSARLISEDSNDNVDTINQRGLGSNIWIERRGTDSSSIWIDVATMSVEINVEQLKSFNSTVEISQLVLGGEARVTQSKADTTNAIITQGLGSDHSASITQKHTYSTTGTATQEEGANLIASIYQSNGTDLLAAIDQSGSRNEAEIMQMNTSGVDAYISQSGSDSYAVIVQTDGSNSGNVSTITQTGNGYSASISQAGTDNLATIVQM